MENFVALDLGASTTRIASENGHINIIPNNMVFLGENTVVGYEPNGNTLEEALEAIITKDGADDFYPCHVLIGDMAERWNGTNERPTVLRNKHEQKINYISAVIGTALSKISNGLGEEIKLYVALPPMEVRYHKDKFKDRLVGRYNVSFPKYGAASGVNVAFTIVDVVCLEESLMATLSYYFGMDGKLKENGRKYRTGNVLSLDIGASTTDLCIVKNGKYLDKSGQTYKTGGNVAIGNLADQIRAEFGFDATHDLAERAMAEGRLQMGNSYVDISNMVDSAKESFAKSVVSSLDGYFRQMEIPLQTIRAIIVSGGGSVRSSYTDEDGTVTYTSKPMSDYITKALIDVCKGIEVEEYDGNPRLANIIGTFIKAKLEQQKALRVDVQQ